MARTVRAGVASLVGALALLAIPTWAFAEPQGRIQDLTTNPGTVTFVLSADGLADGQRIEAGSVKATINGVEVRTSTRGFLGDTVRSTGGSPDRTVLLVLDSSGSMAQASRMETAKQAAKLYLTSVPADVNVGLVSFADDARVRVKPTRDRAKVGRAIDALVPTGATALNDAIQLAVTTLGTTGARNAVLLSDGKDEGSAATTGQAAGSLAKSGVVLDAVSLGTGDQQKQLAAFAKAGNGTLVTATDAAGLTEAFEEAARSVSSQLAVTAEVPADMKAGTADLAVTARVGSTTITDTAAVLVKPARVGPTGDPYGPVAVAQAGSSIVDRSWFLGAVLAAVFLSITAIALVAIGFLDAKNRTEGRVARRLEGVPTPGAPSAPGPQSDTALGSSPALVKAVSFADRVAAGRDTTAIAQRLEQANVALRPGEWVIVHSLIAVLAGLGATLLSGFDILISVLAFVVGLVAPWMYLGFRAARRKRAFYEALPDAMQMLAGSLSAGYSLPQAFDNVAKESGGPLGEELNRALMESRLGMPLEDTLEAAAQRMASRDFHWVVMAIRINRQVGGNLAEVLTNVGRTLRERERLRRQVKTLSAEGVLSAWIVGSLPFAMLGYMLLVQRDYIMPMFTEPMGWLMLAGGATLYAIGVVWLRGLVKMEV